MEIIYLLIPLALILVVIIILAYMWAVKSGQFDDMEGPAHKILIDDDSNTHIEPDNTDQELNPPK